MGNLPRIHFILVDYENTNDIHLAGLDGKPVKIIVFLGKDQKKVPRELLLLSHQHADKFEFVESRCTGKNALDFVLSYKLGELAATHPQAAFHIVSKDTGFDSVVKHLGHDNPKVSCRRHPKFSDVAILHDPRTTSPDDKAILYARALASSKSPPPRRLKTLSSALNSYFDKTMTDDEITTVIGLLTARGVLAIDTQGKVSYPAAEEIPAQPAAPTA